MSKSIVIAGGGTGGHLYPGIALARALKNFDAAMDITFVGTKRGIEARVLPKEGFALKTIDAGGLLEKKWSDRLVSSYRLLKGIGQSLVFLKEKRPGLVVGVGGYVSAPLVFAAWLSRIPILLHEQNSLPGSTNRWLGKLADKIAVSFPGSERYFPIHKVVETGNMIREEFSRTDAEPAAATPFRILVLGGSQGARSINAAMTDALRVLRKKRDAIHIVHQTGEKDHHWVSKKYQESGISHDVLPFIDDMGSQYKKASLIVSRAGATTLAEITAGGKTALLIPFPYAAANHQEHNARVLVEANAGRMIRDPELTGTGLAHAILKFIDEPETLKEMGQNSRRLGKPQATQSVLKMCLDLLNHRNGTVHSNGNDARALSCF